MPNGWPSARTCLKVLSIGLFTISMFLPVYEHGMTSTPPPRPGEVVPRELVSCWRFYGGEMAYGLPIEGVREVFRNGDAGVLICACLWTIANGAFLMSVCGSSLGRWRLSRAAVRDLSLAGIISALAAACLILPYAYISLMNGQNRPYGSFPVGYWLWLAAPAIMLISELPYKDSKSTLSSSLRVLREL